MSKIKIYTDGAASPNPGKGGYGSILIYGEKRKELSQGYTFTTNNRMELMGVIAALECLKQVNLDIDLYSDSKYVVDSIELGWYKKWIVKKFKGIKNQDLWERIITQYNKHNIKFNWVKGHASNVENNNCDILATTAAKGTNLIIDVGYI